MNATVVPYTLQFARPAGTSRGVYNIRKSWFIVLRDGDRVGVGECAPLPNLSCDDLPNYEELIGHFCRIVERDGGIDLEELRQYPSILFGFETALRDLQSANHIFWDTPFVRGEQGITINGLIWMGTHEYMLQQIGEKVEKGFRCLKLKVGAIDFDEELDLVKRIRQRFAPGDLEIRLDANGGFTPANALARLSDFAKHIIHSIEQPIRAGQIAEMACLAGKSPIPIALDEELIGVNTPSQKQLLLDEVNPHYIILKPSLHGGLIGAQEWINLASEKGIGWWITSALESNVGLNAIAQWCASLGVVVPQGLGTGMLFTNNIASPLYINGQKLMYRNGGEWKLDGIVE
ncbi:o-succinylbenzoate synthase [uncultured Acetobacteroides sp.]|uniref:o-succinylbenzoate synthase n=1 Tax=uncultured Acetobacteroides sp. TaxID=1760811 RepID=UPI0029F4BA23|nr:o-succinylbenzoate synthase [uncultured Acetobacteroides sp.]